MKAISKGYNTSQLAVSSLWYWLALSLVHFLPGGVSLPGVHVISSPSFSNHPSLLSFSGSARWAWVIWTPGNEGRAGRRLPINFPEIITCRKIIGFPVWLIVWSLPQGPPGTSGYPGTMGPPGLPVSYSCRLIITEIWDWQQSDIFNGWIGGYTDMWPDID